MIFAAFLLVVVLAGACDAQPVAVDQEVERQLAPKSGGEGDSGGTGGAGEAEGGGRR